ncbi:hypothetical protein KBY96_15530 [Cyanobium sp. ATX 6A2]|uniref:hypothetical protein n=1 Tax=Cyanobium sp. ATX 6A2 TaxID=2823700 RepID=UPI0020CD578E|nr:hypothetical protein [Cyanobium sp. ATX 6A2]MCP9889327.1 hypothetical protein [Cyanobium sp. ATX 6A2]
MPAGTPPGDAAGGDPLRIAGDPLHLPLLQAAMATAPLQLAFLPPDRWAQRLLARSVDAVLVSVSGDARRDPAVLQPPLLRWGVDAIGLGQRSLVLLHHPAHLGRAHPMARDQAPCAQPLCGQPRWGEPPGGRQRMGYLLPPRQQMPLLHRALEREGRLPLHAGAERDHRLWLRQLTSEPLLLPPDLTLLTLPHWREAGLAQLLAWWGGPQLRRPQQRERPRVRRWSGLGGLWGWR